jgi:hypothetical protein
LEVFKNPNFDKSDDDQDQSSQVACQQPEKTKVLNHPLITGD